MPEIHSVNDFRAAIRQGSYTSLGSYPLFFLMADGECLHPKCAKAERRQILEAIIEPDKHLCSDWRAVGYDINYEDGDMVCAHCNERIESAYNEPEETDAKTDAQDTL